MSGRKRLVGVDHGTRRVGIAKTDPLALFAQPVGTFSPDEALDVLVAIDAEDGIETLVIGWPIDADENENPQTARVDEYIVVLKESLPATDIVKWDERGSSREAREELVRAGSKRKHRSRRGATDRVAAALILQQYLDDRNAGPAGAF